MSCKAEVVLDSLSPWGVRSTTFLIKFPRFILPEVLTHRVKSRNTSSSRAIPVLRQIQTTVRDMAAPVEWGSNKPGMQAGPELTGLRRFLVKSIWYGTGYAVALSSYLMSKLGAHKQIANRPLEPWTHVTMVMTATSYANWFELRYHEDADPTIQTLAAAMWRAYQQSEPQVLEHGEWHLPFILPAEQGLPLEDRQVLSAARCASTSFNKVGSKDLLGLSAAHKIWDKLITSKPMHASPVEHQCSPDRLIDGQWEFPELHGNLKGMIQLRKTLPEEAIW